jgi:RNA polymerase-interacting CarD/CdnL/TRCF family regulator
VESRSVSGQVQSFLKLEVQKSSLSRSVRPEPAIWVPSQSAQERGVRAVASPEQAAAAFSLLASREYFFSLQENWSSIQHRLESTIRSEGLSGLAKAKSFLHVLKQKQVVPSPEVVRLDETVHRQLIRELSEVQAKESRQVEEQVQKALRNKLLPDH